MLLLGRGLAVEPETLPGEGESPALVRAQEFLFSDRAPPPASAGAPLVVFSAPGEAQESVELARIIQKEAGAGVPFDEMAILLHSPRLYTPLIEDALDRAGIPFSFEAGAPRPHPSGRAFLALLYCAAEKLSASRFAEYLSLGQVPEPADVGGAARDRESIWEPPRHDLAPPTPPAPPRQGPRQLELFAEPELRPAIAGTLRAPWRWEDLLVDAAVIGGRDRWERRLDGLSRELEARLFECDDESPQARGLRRQSEDLEHLRSFAVPLVGLLDELPERTSWGEWLDRLDDLARAAIAEPEGVLAALQELRPMASVGPVEIWEVCEALRDRLPLLAQPPPAYRYGRVWVAPIEAARGMSFEVALVPGLAERLFPRKISEDPLLLDETRRRLDGELPLQEDRIARERLRLRLAVGAARRKLVLSYPSVDSQKGRARVPSFYLLEVKRASEGTLPGLESLESESAASSGARIGWPAPRHPADAIDIAEHDLGFLAETLHAEATGATAEGAGRYLVEVNPFLTRSLRARYRQWGLDKFTLSEGLVDASTEAKRALGAHRWERRPYSVTALEQFAGCPYRFFLYAIETLRPRETVAEITHLDALTRGAILHAVQFRLLTALRAEGLLPVRQETLDSAFDLAHRVFDDVTREYEDLLAPAIPRIWRDELDRMREDIRGWLRREARGSGNWLPFRFEFTFGMKPHGPADPSSVLEPALLPQGLRLRGAIDLVEKRSDGAVRVTDIKTGKAWVPSSAILFGGRSLQRLFYALAYSALTGEKVVESRLYYSTARGGYTERTIDVDETALEVMAEFVRRVDRSFEEGFFPASPFPGEGCRFCDYQSICGPHAESVAARKSADPRLAALDWLRSLT
jgi:RecB family exonuclease